MKLFTERVRDALVRHRLVVVPMLAVYVALEIIVLTGGSSPRSTLHAQQQRGVAINCVVTTSTATTLQAVPAPCTAPLDNQALYITGVHFSASATGIAADAFPTLKSSTDSCATGTIIWGALTAAAYTQVTRFDPPIRLPTGTALCWITSTAGSKFVEVTGYVGP